MDSRCHRKDFSRLSPVIAWVLLPVSSMKSFPAELMWPRVSKAMGTKEYLDIIFEYFCSFFPAATSAADPVIELDPATLLAASVSVTVTSQLTHLPSDQGIWVTPSGRFPSDLTNPCGSLTREYWLDSWLAI